MQNNQTQRRCRDQGKLSEADLRRPVALKIPSLLPILWGWGAWWACAHGSRRTLADAFSHSFPFLFQFCFNWRIITVQYCDGFCHTSIWVGHTYKCVPLILNPPPTSSPDPSLWVVPEPQLWVPCFMHQTCTGQLFPSFPFNSRHFSSHDGEGCPLSGHHLTC